MRVETKYNFHFTNISNPYLDIINTWLFQSFLLENVRFNSICYLLFNNYLLNKFVKLTNSE